MNNQFFHVRNHWALEKSKKKPQGSSLVFHQPIFAGKNLFLPGKSIFASRFFTMEKPLFPTFWQKPANPVWRPSTSRTGERLGLRSSWQTYTTAPNTANIVTEEQTHRPWYSAAHEHQPVCQRRQRISSCRDHLRMNVRLGVFTHVLDRFFFVFLAQRVVRSALRRHSPSTTNLTTATLCCLTYR